MKQDKNFALRVMRNLVTPTFVLDSEGKVIIWNRAMERLTGMPASELLGTKEHWRAFYTEYRPCLADVFLSGNHSSLNKLYEKHLVSDSSEHSLSAENWGVMPNIGHRKYLAIDAGPVYDELGNLIAVVETIRDMSELRAARDALHEMAVTDGLTGLGNRRAFDEHLRTAWLTCRRYHQPISMLMIDVDYFKQFNDRYGHPEGDRVLKYVADAIAQSVLRPVDKCFRYGGEEFAVLLSDTDGAGAREVASRILNGVIELDIEHSKSPYTRITISIGVASADADHTDDPAILAKSADEKLYHAKANGRSRVEG